MEVETEMKQSWELRIRAKAKHFDFKLKVNSLLPNSSWSSWKLQRLSLLLKLHKFQLNFKSESPTSTFSVPKQRSRRRTSNLLSRVFRSIRDKFQIRQAKKKNNPITNFPLNRSRKFPYMEPVFIGSVVFGILEILSKIFWGKFQEQIISVIVLSIQLCFQKWKKSNTLLVYLMGASVICSVVLQLINTKFSKLVWMAWKFSVSSGCFYAIFQEILSRICNCKSVMKR